MKHSETVARSEASPSLVFDVSTLTARAHRRPTGIERIQLEIALAMVKQSRADVSFCRYDAAGGRFEIVSHAEVQAIGDLMRGASGGATPRRTRPLRGAAPARRVSSLARQLTAHIPSALPHIRRMAGHGWRAVAEAVRAIRALPKDVAAHVPRWPRQQAACATSEWTAATTYCSVGMDWLHNDLALVAKQKSSHGFRTALMVHDLLPSVAPQYSGVNVDEYFLSVLAIADTVIVNSGATAHDLEVFAADHHMPVPDVTKLPLGSVLADLVAERPDSVAAEIEGSYILCVGTITIRKNHHLLFDVWERLIAERSAGDVPTLIVAGAKGWISDETMSRLQRTPAFKGVVLHIPDATDENIAWLYQNCAFTVYPSLYEGWGLPVSESHDFGKLCLTSDRSSLPEAGEGLAELLDPYDRNLWRERIVHFLNDAEARSEREKYVMQNHVRITARDSADAILSAAGLSPLN
jgi:glycosyltransferase involved in cell wall biosynthesis